MSKIWFINVKITNLNLKILTEIIIYKILKETFN